MTAQQSRRFRIFLSSPDDVPEERRLAAELVEQVLAKDPGLRGYSFELVRWDDPHAPTPMDAVDVPQASVNWVKGRPSECNVVVVTLWSRLGSPFEFDGRSWASGTEWEYEEAINASPRPRILVYHRTEKPRIDIDDPAFEAKRAQYRAA